MKRFFLGTVLAATCITANALEEFAGHVTYLEPTYLPAVVQFTMDSGSTSCPVGRYLKWQKSDESNNKAIYSTLLLSIATGKRVRLYVNDGDTTCVGQYFHLLND